MGVTKPPAQSGARIIDPVLLTLIEFDVTLDESYEDTVEWTEYPVETGIPITDHAIIDPVRLTLSGVITDTPTRPGAVPFRDRSRLAYERLLALKDARTLVTVVTSLRPLANMGIESVDLKRDATTGQAVTPVVTLKQIRIVNSVSVPIPPEILSPPAKAGQQSQLDAGKQSAGASSDETREATDVSTAKRIEQEFGGGGTLADLIKGVLPR